MMTSPLVSTIIATALATRGYRRKSLSKSGAVAAAVVGGLHWVCGTRFGLILILFYLSSSKLTHWRQDAKAKLEAGHKEGGQRNAYQVLANSATGLLLTLAARHGAPHLWPADPLAAAFLLAAFLGHYAACTADTWASEVGILSSRPPRLITTLQVTKPGVNGGVSALGTAAGAAGALLIGAASWALEVLTPSHILGAVAPSGLLGGGFAAGAFGPWNMALGLFAGLLGNTVDSLLGATLQFSGVESAARGGKVVSAPGPGVRRLCGRDVLSNDAVNFLSAAVAAGLTGLLAVHWAAT